MSAGRKRRPAGERQPRVSPARRAAFEVLRRVEEEDAYASVLLAASEDDLSREDRALSYEIVLGVLRRQLWLDYLIEHYTGRRASRLDRPVRRALRMGLYQLRFLSRIPPSAVVNEAVNLAHLARLRSAAPLINAALRRATRETDYDPSAAVTEPLEKISVRHSHPPWLIERWAAQWGLEETEKFAAANNLPPPVAFRVVHESEDGKRVPDELRAGGAEVEASKVAPSAWRVKGAPGLLRELAQAGRIYLQDEASQLVAHALGAKAGERILDACAAPGSKTTHVASLTGDRALVVAADLHTHRLRALLESCARQNLRSVRAVTHDAARALPFAAETFDAALVDAPCTGTGTLRRNPEIRWRIRAEDIRVMQGLQLGILRNAARAVRRGGRLIYSTCSVEPEEGEQVVAEFLRLEAGWRERGASTRTWPHREGADGFFIAALERA